MFQSKSLFRLAVFVLFLWSSPMLATQNIQMSADQLEVDALNNRVLASGNVIVQQQDIFIYGTRANYDQNTQIAKITGNVTVKKAEMKLKCNYVIANGADNSLTAYDEIEFSFKDITGKSQRADYSTEEKRVKFSGDPIVKQGTDSIKGEIIYVDLERQKVTTEGNAKVIFSLDKVN